jgi:DNA-binding transcriptional MerR regulator
MAEDRYVLVGEAARLLEITPNGVRLLAWQGKLTAERVGRIRIFLRSDVQRLAVARSAKKKAKGKGDD